ncbi:Tn7-like element transposition protein TnsE [Paenibacillus assamensis]|uniref:Tn7-like element transposition protein TnsE n=1 Tax=Paenibacillus assamensis TaxID=311244 RepID=UPI0004094669|nr:Tn7-like element transposition protein TnsE [Paenibacillus assamensis]
MAALTLRPWPFPEDQEAELYWFGSPYMDYKENWRIRVAFRTSSTNIKVVSYPWGTLPDLRIGRLYTKGKYDPVKPLSGSAYSLLINKLSQGTVVNSFKLPKRLIDLNKNPELGLQNIIQFKVDSLTYCIPVIEFIRAMFVNSKNMALHLLQPHGLELLVDQSEMYGDVLHFDMSARVPAKLAIDSNARHLSWIYMDARIRAMWDSVYQHLFSQAIKNSPQNPQAALKKGIPLGIDLTEIGPLQIHVRGEQFIDYILVKEIIGFSGFEHPHEKISFWHPSKKRRESTFGDKQVRLTSRADNDNYILNDESDHAKEDIHQDVLEAPPTFMHFSNIPVVSTRRQHVRQSNTGQDVIFNSGRGGKTSGAQEEVSTQESVVGGDTSPIDFQTLETIPASEGIGLESFFEMIQLLKQTFPVKVSMSILRIPPGRRFSVCPNGARRTCAVVQITSAVSTAYILEVARPDNWSISTLILRPSQQASFKVIEDNIKQLLEGLVHKGGHWDRKVLERCNGVSVEKLKHYQNDTAIEWASRLMSKIL